MAEIEVQAETERQKSWILVAVGGFVIAGLLVACMVGGTAFLGSPGLFFVGAIALFAGTFGAIAAARARASLRQPSAVLILAKPSFKCGESHSIRWRITRGANRVRGVRAETVAREIVFLRKPVEGIVERQEARRIPIGFGSGPAGSGQLDIPRRAMPTFRAGAAQIEWYIELSGKIGDTDWDQRFPIQVDPC